MTTEQSKSIREILEEALNEIRREHGVSVHSVRVEWLGTMVEPETAPVYIDVECKTWV